ncbi:MAG: PAS domain-containing protein [Bdellovibrionales bacterium]
MTSNTHLPDRIVDRMERIAHVGHWRWNVKDESLFWSKGIYKIHGLDFQDHTPSIEAALDAYVPEDREIVEKALAHAIENKTEFTIEARIQRPNGSLRNVIVHGECECNEKNGLIAVFGILQDITHVKQQEELYRLSAMGSSSAVWEWNLETDELRWAGRSAQVLGYDLNDNLPKSTEKFFKELLHPDDRDTLKETLIKHFTKTESFKIECRIANKNGEYEWFSARAQAQFNNYRKAIYVCGSMTSIQALKEIQNQLENSNTDLANFAAIAAHEIKHPIRTIGNYLELIQISSQTLEEDNQDYFKKAIQTANETNVMIDNLLEYASLENAKLTLDTVNIEKLTKLIIRSLKQEIKDTQANITIEPLHSIKADEIKIKTVITNLIQNALKYASDRPIEIKITMIENKDEWVYCVQDNGRGIDDKNKETIFQMFERADNIGNTKGTGIGLAVCQRIINLHKGSIRVESEINKGSTFTFSIPKEP